MQKQKKQFLILCIVLIAFVAVFFIMKAVTKQQEEKEAAQAEAEKITALTLNTEEITEFTYQYEDTSLTFVKEEDTWYYQEDKTIPISQTMIETMLSNVAEITAEQQITATDDISQYGMDTPLSVIALQMGETTVTITVGMQNTITSQYYMMVSNDDTVYLTDSTVYSAFQKSVEDLTEVEEDSETEDATEGEIEE